MGRRHCRLSLLAAFVLAALVATLAVARAETPVYNTAFLTDDQLENATAMNPDQVRAFLLSQGSYFSRPVVDVDGVAFDPWQTIADAAATYEINPQVLLATLQKEAGAVTNANRPSDQKMKNLMGCGPASTAREQITCAAERFRSYQDRLTLKGASPSGWQVGVAKTTQDGVSVTPATKAVAGQFTYTPYAGTQWGGNQRTVGGVYLFYKSWQDFGFGAAPISEPSPPSRKSDCTHVSWPVLPPDQAGKKVGIQAGHWEYDSGATTTTPSDVWECEVNAAIAVRVATLLREAGFDATLFSAKGYPGATALAGYEGDAFVALHADNVPNATGYAVCRFEGSPIADRDDALVAALVESYGKATGLPEHPTSCNEPNAKYYYGLNRTADGIAATTPGVLIEMGYLSTAADNKVLTEQQDEVAAGIVAGLVAFLGEASPPGPPANDAQMAQAAAIALVLPGEKAHITFTVRNTGANTWTPPGYALAASRGNPAGLREALPLRMAVASGDTASWTVTWTAEGAPGVKRLEYRMRSDGEEFGAPVTGYIVVLPPQLKGMREKLQRQVDEWQREGKETAEQILARLWEEVQRLLKEASQTLLDRFLAEVNRLCSSAFGMAAGGLALVLLLRRRVV